MTEPVYIRDEPATPGMGVHLPLTLLALTVAVFLGAQIGAVRGSGQVMRWQLSNVDKQLENAKTAQKQLADESQKRDELLKQAAQVEQQYTALLTDVTDLAKDDDDAKKVVQKWNIQRAQPPAQSGTPAAGDAGAKPAATTPAP